MRSLKKPLLLKRKNKFIRPKYLLACILILAWGVRFAYLLEVRHSADFYLLSPGMDEYNYDRLAYSLARGDWLSPQLVYCLSLYPGFLAFIYVIAGRSLLAIRIVQLLMGTACSGLTYLLGKRTLGAGRGLLAALIVALYGMAVFHETLLIPTTLALFTSLLVLVWWSRLQGSKSPRDWFIGGILLGLSSLAAAANLLFAVILIFFWPIREKKERRLSALLKKGAAAGLGMLLVILPFSLRNFRSSGSSVFLSAHAGINFYLGNNPESNGGFKAPRFLTPSAAGIIRDSNRVAEAVYGRRLNPGKVSRFWFKQGLSYLVRHPFNCLRLWLKKIRLFLSPREYCDVGSSRLDGCGELRIHGIPFLKFGWLAPWVYLGFFLSYRQRKKSLLLYLFAAAQIAGVMLFFHQARARLILLPVGALWAAESFYFFRKILAERRFKLAAGCLLLLVILYALLGSQPRVEMRSETNLLITAAQEEMEEGDYPAAREKVETALRINPDLGGAFIILGDIFSAGGEIEKAAGYYARAKRRQPRDPGPHLRLARLFMTISDWGKAGAELEGAWQVDPLCGEAHSLAARIYFERGEREEEIKEYRKALGLNPNSVKDMNNLAAAYAQKGDLAGAIFLWQRALRISPASRQVRSNLKKALES